MCAASIALCAPDSSQWIPARWDGGPLESAYRKDPLSPDVRAVLADWYNPSTLSLLDGAPINCLLVTLSAGASPEIEARQKQLVGNYARLAHKRGIAVLGVVHSGANALTAAAAAAELRLDGLVLDGDFSSGFEREMNRSAQDQPVVIPIWRDASSAPGARGPLLAVEGVRPDARNLTDMGIRGGASAVPWIDSNIWLVRSLRRGPQWQPVWIDQQPSPSSPGDYSRCVADAAVAGGRWIIALDDDLRTRLFRREAASLGEWRRIVSYLKFAEEHADWRSFAPYGNVGIIVDAASKNPEVSNEYLNLVARRQIPYRLMERSALARESLGVFQAVLALDLASPTTGERNLLNEFATNGGTVVAGPWWGGAPKDDSFIEVPTGKGRAVIYKDEPPDPESVAKDLVELLEPNVLGLSLFNVPSAISYISTRDKQVLIQLLNYATIPSKRVTVRFNGRFHTARYYSPEDAPIELAVHATENGRTEFLIPQLTAWGAVLLE